MDDDRELRPLGGLSQRDRLAIAEKSPSGQATFVVDKSNVTRLWDVLDQAWTKPLPTQMVSINYLTKIAYVCSACYFQAAFGGQVARHVRQVLNHRDAELVTEIGEQGQTTGRCTGCDQSMRMVTGSRHLASIKGQVEGHRGARERIVRRFALGPSEPEVLREVVVDPDGASLPRNGHHGPTGATVERRLRKRRRRRSRGRKGSGE